MNSFKTFAIRTLAVSALTVAALGNANAAIFIRAGVVVVPVCRFVAIPVVNAWTGLTYLVTRRVCN